MSLGFQCRRVILGQHNGQIKFSQWVVVGGLQVMLNMLATLLCLISVGYRLESCIAIILSESIIFYPNNISTQNLIFSVTNSNCKRGVVSQTLMLTQHYCQPQLVYLTQLRYKV